jgi:hypothetical protein
MVASINRVPRIRREKHMAGQHLGSGAEEAWNMRLLGHSDLGGHGDGMHVNLRSGLAYVGHMGEGRVGTSVVDVTNPTNPKLVHQIQTPPGTHSHKVQVVDDILVVNYEKNMREPEATTWEAGFKVFDLSDPQEPREIGFFPMKGSGCHRMTYWEAPYIYMSASDEGYTDRFFMVADLSDPTQPTEVGRWWVPGMHAAGGETPDWPEDRRFWHHHPLLRGSRAYCPWWDGGLVILDVSDLSKPRFISRLDFGPESRSTHSAVPIPGRDILVGGEEAIHDAGEGIQKNARIVDISDEENPTVTSVFPVPEGDYPAREGRFGPHNLHEMRPGSYQDSEIVFLTYFSAGIRVYDISDVATPKEVAYYVPPAPPGRSSIQLNDLIVDADGLVYVTDRYTGGLYILETLL